MASAAQIAANRANAQRSSGPRSDAGRRASSQNSTKHGLTGHAIVRQPDQEEAWQAYRASMLPDLAPANALERDLADRIIHDSWRLNRAAAMDENLLLNRMFENYDGPGNVTVPDGRALAEARAFRSEAKTFNLLSLYSQRLERSVHKNLALLKALQKDRTQQPSAPRPASFQQNAGALKAALQQHAEASAASPQPVDSPALPPEIGFVFANDPRESATPPQPHANAFKTLAA